MAALLQPSLQQCPSIFSSSSSSSSSSSPSSYSLFLYNGFSPPSSRPRLYSSSFSAKFRARASVENPSLMTDLRVPEGPVIGGPDLRVPEGPVIGGPDLRVPERSVIGDPDLRIPERSLIRLGLPSKGRMATDTLDLLKDCQLNVKQGNPRQYVARIQQLPTVEVWFQRPKDIVRKLLSGDLDLGIVGFDTVCEYGQGSEDLIIVHDALDYGDCRLSLAIPNYGIFENINSMEELAQMLQWTAERPLRVATGFTYLGPRFMKENGMKHVSFSTADGALEAAPAMGIADAILDLVSSGTTLRENNLKEIEGGTVVQSEAVLVACKKSLTKRQGVLDVTHEILERLEAHLVASGQFTVVANMRGSSAEEVAQRVLSQPSLSGLQGPTISPVFCNRNGKVSPDYYAITICVPKKALYNSVHQLRAIGGSGVLVSPLTYIFDEETPRWRELLSKLGL